MSPPIIVAHIELVRDIIKKAGKNGAYPNKYRPTAIIKPHIVLDITAIPMNNINLLMLLKSGFLSVILPHNLYGM